MEARTSHSPIMTYADGENIQLEELKEWLKKNPDSELARLLFIEGVQALILEDVNNYGSLDLDDEFERIKNQDPIRNIIIERTIQSYLLRNNKVMADMTVAREALRKRFQEIERFKKAKPLKRLLLKASMALKVFFSDSAFGERVKELESILAETVIAESRLKEAQEKTVRTTLEANELLIAASDGRRLKLEVANDMVLRITEQAYKEAHDIRINAGQDATEIIRKAAIKVETLELEIARLRAKKSELLEESPGLVAVILHEQDKLITDIQSSLSEFENLAKQFSKLGDFQSNDPSQSKIRAIMSFNRIFYDLVLVPIAKGLTRAREKTIVELRTLIYKLTYLNIIGPHQNRKILMRGNVCIPLVFYYRCLESLIREPDKAESILLSWEQNLLESESIPNPNTDKSYLDTAKYLSEWANSFIPTSFSHVDVADSPNQQEGYGPPDPRRESWQKFQESNGLCMILK